MSVANHLTDAWWKDHELFIELKNVNVKKINAENSTYSKLHFSGYENKTFNHEWISKYQSKDKKCTSEVD